MTGATSESFKYFRVYNCFGYPVTDLRFVSFDDVNKFAEFLVEHYQEYFILWYENPKFDVPGLTRYTIPEGLKLYAIFKKFSNQVIRFEDIKNEYTRLGI